MIVHQYSDRARRASGVVALARVAYGDDLTGKWLAIRLSDGSSDGVPYPRKSDAVRHQLHPRQCAYVCVPPDDMSPRQAETYLRFMEQLYDAGADLADPDRQIHMPARREHVPGLIRAVKRGV